MYTITITSNYTWRTIQRREPFLKGTIQNPSHHIKLYVARLYEQKQELYKGLSTSFLAKEKLATFGDHTENQVTTG